MFTPRAVLRLGTLAATMLLPLVGRAQSPGVAWRTNLDAAKIEAGQSNRLLLVHFWRPSCGPCRVLDQTVFNQPHVGSSIEQSFVPVKVDTEASPALASFFRIEKLPTDVVIDGQGKVLAALPCPMSADAYLEQLNNLVHNVRQGQATGSASAGGAEAAPVNAAYANLPMSRTTPTMPAAGPPAGRYAAAAPVPSQQVNPFVAGAPAPGQARASYPSQTATGGQTPPGVAPQQSMQSAMTPPSAPPQDAGLPTLPATAMPRSYQTSITANQPAGAPIAAATQNQFVAAPTAPPVAPPVQSQAAASPYPVTQPAAVQAAPAPKTVQLPPGCPPLAFDGCCPVTLKGYKKWATGDVTFGAVHRGRTYLFVGPKERDQFMANPDAYSPVFAGLDPVLLLDGQQSVPGTRKFGYEYDGRFYLFSSRETMERFASSAPSYAAGVRQAMNKIDGASGGVIRR